MNADDEKVFVAVIVVVAHRDTHTVTFALQTGLRSYVSEGSIAIISIKFVPELRPHLGKRGQRCAMTARFKQQPSRRKGHSSQ